MDSSPKIHQKSTEVLQKALSNKDRIYLSFYTSRDRAYEYQVYGSDVVDTSVRDELGWRNLTVTGRWNRLLGSKIFVNTLLGLSLYRSRNQDEERNERGVQHISFLSGITDGIGRIDFEYIPVPSHHLRFGFGTTIHSYHTGAFSESWSGTDVVPFDTLYTPDYLNRAMEVNAYVEDELRLSSMLLINAGVHASSFFVGRHGYHSVQPRVGLRWRLNSNSSLKFSFASMKQYVHLLATTSGISLPLDLWVPATTKVRPQEAIQYGIGLTQKLRNGNYDIAVEGFYKTINNVIAYKDGTHHYSYTPSDNWENRVAVGNGLSYGAELFVHKKRGRITGWIGYSLTKTNHTFADLNNGKSFPYRYDRLHDVSLAVNIQWNESVRLAFTWVYGTGQAVWLPLGQSYGRFHRPIPQYSNNSVRSEVTPIRVYGERNSYRMPEHHRLDIAIHMSRKLKWAQRRLSFGVYNAYYRKNAFAIEVTQRSSDFEEAQYLVFNKITAFPIIPSVNYRLDF